MMLRHGLLALLLIVATATNTALASIESAAVTGGTVRGQAVDGVGVFKGIPFAAPPVGELRWQVPKPVIAWQGVRDANVFAPACLQPWNPAEQPQPSEDCLYLNVWTAAASPSERRPVIVWIHGGGLVGGMSWEKVSDDDALIAAYPRLVSDEQTRTVVRQSNRDQGIGWSTWTWARLQTAYGRSPVYAYFFDIHPHDRPHGAPHATEYPYIFGNFQNAHTQRDLTASAIIRQYVINFAASGDPNAAGLPHWDEFDETTQRVMVFDELSRSREWPNLAALKAFTPLLQCFAGLPAPNAGE